MTDQRCRTCALYDEQYRDEDDPDSEHTGSYGDCLWDPGPLPFSWRWCKRERMNVAPHEGATCPQWKLKIEEPVEKKQVD